MSLATDAQLIVKLAAQGSPLERKNALRQIDQTPQLAPDILELALPMLADSEPLERHRTTKIVRRVISVASAHTNVTTGDSRLISLAPKLLVAIRPMLLDQLHLTRQQGKELLCLLATTIGMAPMFRLLRQDLESQDEYVRRLTAAAIAALAPIQLSNVVTFTCAAAKSTHELVRNTGLRAIAEISRQVPGAILSKLPLIVTVIKPALDDPVPQCRISACAAVTALATACSPFGIESLEQCIPHLWSGTRTHRGKGLAWFISALASLVPLMDPDSAPEYAHSVLGLCSQFFTTPDDLLKKSICRAIASASTAADPLVMKPLVGPFFKNFWVRRLALDYKACQLILDATSAFALAGADVLSEIVATNSLKDSSPPFQSLGLDALERQLTPVAAAAAPERTQEQICDGLVAALRSSKATKKNLIAAFRSFFKAMGQMLAPYIDPLTTVLVECLNNPLAAQRELACLVIIPLLEAIKLTGDTKTLTTLGSVLNEQLGEESPEVLTAVLQGLQAVCNVLDMKSMQPPVGELLPRLTPILRNRNDDVAQAAIALIGVIAQSGPENVGAREWMRICNELIEIFKAPRKSVRRMANNTFGYIAKGIGPQDVLASLLTSLKLERQSRVNAAVAMAIVADTCEPFSVLPALMNEYRSPSIHVQHGALKALSFVFEYTPAPQYLDSIVSLVDHALTSRNQVSRQTGAGIVKHLALKSIGCNHEETFIHLLNEVWPHIFETSPHVIDRVLQAVEAVQAAVGVGAVVPYIWAGMFHSAKKTRQVYWKIYNTAYVQSQHALVAHYPVNVDAMDVWF